MYHIRAFRLWSFIDGGFEQVWTSLNKSEQVWASLNMYEQVWTSLNKFGQVWTCRNKFEQVWTSLNKFEQVWTSLNMYEQVWTSLNKSSYLKLLLVRIHHERNSITEPMLISSTYTKIMGHDFEKEKKNEQGLIFNPWKKMCVMLIANFPDVKTGTRVF